MAIGTIEVAVTGCGMFSPLGKGEEALSIDKASALLNTCRLSPHDHAVTGELGEKGWRATLLAIAASRMALGQALPLAAEPSRRTGVILGTSLMDLGALERYLTAFGRDGPQAIPPWALHYGLPLAHASHVAVSLHLNGMCETLSDPITAGISAIGMGYRAIALGEERSLLAGGVDSPPDSIFLDILAEALSVRSRSRPAEGCALFHLQAAEPGSALPAAKAAAYICGYAAAFTESKPERREGLIHRLAAQSFPDGEGIDLLLDTAALPDPIPRMLAAGPALACGLAISLMGSPRPEFPPKTWPAGPFFRDQEDVHRVIVTAEGPTGGCAAIALLSRQERNKIGMGERSAVFSLQKDNCSATCSDSPALVESGGVVRGTHLSLRSGRGRDEVANKAVITGMGVASAIGVGRDAFCKTLISGASGVVHHVPPGSGGASPSPAALVSDIPTAPSIRRSTQLVIAAAEEALLDAGLHRWPSAETAPGRQMPGLYLGETLSSVETWIHLAVLLLQDKKDPRALAKTLQNIRESTTACVAKRFALSGEAVTFASGCTGGLIALGRAARDVLGGGDPLILTGGVDSNLFPFAFGILSRAKLLTSCQDPNQAGRPFDRERDGEVTGEGSAMFIVEHPDSAAGRGAKPYAVVSGFGAAGDGHHFKYNKPDGEALLNAVRAALNRARLDASQIDLVIAHASGFKGSDAIEVKALAGIFCERKTLPPVVSIKGATGQPFSAGGPLQVAAALCALTSGIIPPTAHFAKADADDPFDHVPTARKAEVPIRHILVTSYGYGGGKAAVILSACGESRS